MAAKDKTQMLNLFVGSAGTCSLAPHLALEEAGATYTVTHLDMASGAHKAPDYLKINPKARVPALATDKGIITENPAILAFIAQTHPKSRLAPNDPFLLAQLNSFNSYLCSTVHPAHAHRIRGARWSDDPVIIEGLKVKVAQNMTDCLKLIQNEYLKGPWVMGEQFTVADCYLYIIASWLEGDGVDPKAVPGIIEHRARVAGRPATQKVLATYS
jgi:glutathione S-transferase